MSLEKTTRRLAGKWQELSTGSVNNRILAALIVIGGLTFGVKVASMVKEVLVAASFGTGDKLEAFLIAFLVPSFFINVVAGSLNVALIPVYIQVRETQGTEAAQRLFSGVIGLSLGLLLLATTLLALSGPYFLPLVGSGFGPEKMALTTRLFYLLLPSIVLNGLAILLGAVLNARERFALASVTAIMTPLSAILFLGISGLAGSWDIQALASGTLVGFLLELVLLGWGLKRQGLRLRPRWPSAHPAVREVIGQYLPALAGSVLMSGTVIVDQTIAAMLSPGSVAALSYGNKLVALVLGIGLMALGTAVLPYFSRMVAAADWAAIRHSLNTYCRLILLVTVPLTFLACIFSQFLVYILFQRGAFTEADTQLVSQIQIMYLLQLPFHTLAVLFVRLISSLRANHILMWGTVISFILNITLDFLLMQWIGLAGIALATTFIYLANCAFLGLMLARRLKRETGTVKVKICELPS
jgi:putative peptidoglycan lipid II flippase